MPRVEYTATNLQNCRCSNCPVRETSACIAGKVAALGQMHTSGATAPMAAPQALQMLFCSHAVGKSECTDLNTKLACNCPGCEVWTSHNLASAYFCSHGAAA
ncbi:MAG: DUF2769 domain-containing protein [Chloroflexi bacterium]|nr:DUF2769 domain-containing protein [Chloroflexota bacterium]